MYNDFHRIEGSEDARFKLWEERLSEAFFLYTILEFSQRAGIKTEFKLKEEGGDQMKWIDRALESYHSRLRDFFLDALASLEFLLVSQSASQPVTFSSKAQNSFKSVSQSSVSHQSVISQSLRSDNPSDI